MFSSSMHGLRIIQDVSGLRRDIFYTRNKCELLTQEMKNPVKFHTPDTEMFLSAHWPHRWCSSGPAHLWSSASAPFPCRLTPRLPSPTGTASASAASSTCGEQTRREILKKVQTGDANKLPERWRRWIRWLTWSSRTACGRTLWCCVPCSRRGAPWEPWTWRSGAYSTRTAPQPACTGGLKRKLQNILEINLDEHKKPRDV